MKSQTKSRLDDFYPTACFELLPAPAAAYFVAILQLFGSLIYFLTYYALERYGYILTGSSLRYSVISTSLLYAFGAICAAYGVFKSDKKFVQYHTWIMQGIMLVTDLVAVAIILIMAIGNRLEFTYTLPRHFVNEHKFYNILGPFWMYLGAISLHITVAINMCFLKVFNTYFNFFDEKLSGKTVTPPVKLVHK